MTPMQNDKPDGSSDRRRRPPADERPEPDPDKLRREKPVDDKPRRPFDRGDGKSPVLAGLVTTWAAILTVGVWAIWSTFAR